MTENKELTPTTEQKEKEKKPMDLHTKVLGDFTQYDINTMRQSLAAGLNTAEFNLFINTAISAGLNPFLGHIAPVIFSPDNPEKRKLNIQVAVEGIEHLARQKQGWLGVETQLIHEKDTFKAKRDKESGGWIIEEHEIGFPRGRVIAGYAIARREGFKDIYLFMEVDEVAHMKTDYRSKAMWEKWFNDMFKKHMKKRALREQFGIELDDMENAGATAATEDGPGDYRKPVKEISQDDDEPDAQQALQDLVDEMERLVELYELKPADIHSIKLQRLGLQPNDAINDQQTAALKRFIEMEGPGIQMHRKAVKAAAEADIKAAAQNAKVDLQPEPVKPTENAKQADFLEEFEMFTDPQGQGRLL